MKESVRRYLSEQGKKGGKVGGNTTLKRYGKKHFSDIGKMKKNKKKNEQ